MSHAEPLGQDANGSVFKHHPITAPEAASDRPKSSKGVAYIARLFGCSRESMDHGMRERDQPPGDPVGRRIRRESGTEKNQREKARCRPNIQIIINERTAGDPMLEDVTWTDLTPREIANRMDVEYAIPITPLIVRRILGSLDYRLRKISKSIPGKEPPDRDGQFLRIADLNEQYLASGKPVISMDTKMQQMVNESGVSVRVAHYPAYCSKFNPIERRLFSQVTHARKGNLFDILATVRSLMEKTSTRTGLSATVRVIEKIYDTGRKASEAFKKNMPIVFDDIPPKWNYRILPQHESSHNPEQLRF